MTGETISEMQEDEHMVRGDLSWMNHKPSWVRWGEGWAALNYMGHKKAGWFSLSIKEHHYLENGKTVTKEVHVTLTKDQAKALFLALAKTLGKKVR